MWCVVCVCVCARAPRAALAGKKLQLVGLNVLPILFIFFKSRQHSVRLDGAQCPLLGQRRRPPVGHFDWVPGAPGV